MAGPADAAGLDRRLRRAESDVDQLIKAGDDTKKALTEHDTKLGNIGRAITTMAEAVKNIEAATRKAEEKKPPPPVASWIQAGTADRAADVLASLEEWLGDVLVHYPDGILKDCWRRHAWVVEELLALRDWYADAWAPGASAGARLDWHDRYRPNAMKRVTAGLDKCEGLSSHVVQNLADFTRPAQVGLDKDQAAELAAWWARSHGASPAPPPSPSALAESAARRDAEMQGGFST